MDKQIIMILGAVILASGCAHSEVGKSTHSGSGLVVDQFRITDNQISPGQQARITLRLKNHHTEDVNITDISLFNTGVLDVEDRGCSPAEEDLGERRQDIVPEMECSWIVSTEELGEFKSKHIPLKLNLEYNSSMKTKKPLKIHFKPLNQIENTKDIEKTFSNSEVRLKMSSSSPASFGKNNSFDVHVNNVGSGKVDNDKYTFSYTPSSLFRNCPDEREFLSGSKIEFSCSISTDSDTGSQITRNLYMTTSYKYVKQPSLDIRVVNQ